MIGAKRAALLSVALLLGMINAFAQVPGRDNIVLDKETVSVNQIKLFRVENKSGDKVKIFINGKYEFSLGAGETHDMEGRIVERVKIEYNNTTINIWDSNDTLQEYKANGGEIPEIKSEKKPELSASSSADKVSDRKPNVRNDKGADDGKGEAYKVRKAFLAHIEDARRYDTDWITEILEIETSILEQALKTENPEEISSALAEARTEVEKVKSKIDEDESQITDYVNEYLNSKKIRSKVRVECTSLLEAVLWEKISLQREELQKLNDLLSDVEKALADLTPEEDKTLVEILKENPAYVVTGLSVVVLIAILLIMNAKKLRERKKEAQRMAAAIKKEQADKEQAGDDIVIRRKTASVLKKQYIDDVRSDPSYMKISCADFTATSAVDEIYIKNSCIRDIYDMYADDLRSPDNPKEDGCMVLGRWVCNPETKLYSITLECIVKPGDDAVFKEYELNFGGKIKLRVTEKLRQLRQQSDLQYDLTCWVHSHPGLGVFFSNSDTNVQMQLKHYSHPLFLAAIVVDILTPDQEVGIFTFKKDGTINAKADLIKMYSLEEMNKWAVASMRASSCREDDFVNMLDSVQMQVSGCAEVKINNNAIIDLCRIAMEEDDGLVGWVKGHSKTLDQGSGHLILSVDKSRGEDEDIIGCLVRGTHCSVPSITRILVESDVPTGIKFILFLSSSDDKLTIIPCVGGQPINDINYFGEKQLEDLKAWTKRKR